MLQTHTKLRKWEENRMSIIRLFFGQASWLSTMYMPTIKIPKLLSLIAQLTRFIIYSLARMRCLANLALAVALTSKCCVKLLPIPSWRNAINKRNWLLLSSNSRTLLSICSPEIVPQLLLLIKLTKLVIHKYCNNNSARSHSPHKTRTSKSLLLLSLRKTSWIIKICYAEWLYYTKRTRSKRLHFINTNAV